MLIFTCCDIFITRLKVSFCIKFLKKEKKKKKRKLIFFRNSNFFRESAAAAASGSSVINSQENLMAESYYGSGVLLW